MRETKAGFRLPDDPSVPIIMIGPGTGLAPFRGFLQERAARKAKGAALGPAMLFFGCRHPEQDFLYADELKGFAADGVSELHTAFSRADGPKTYVQNLLAQQKDKVWSLIEQGAVIFVCGDGSKMEPDVKATLMSIHREKTGGNADAAAKLDRRDGHEEPLRARRVGGRLTSRAASADRAGKSCMIPWVKIDTARIPGSDGELRLMRRGAEFSIKLGTNELMNSRLSGSEAALATLACQENRGGQDAACADRRIGHGLYAPRRARRVGRRCTGRCRRTGAGGRRLGERPDGGYLCRQPR